MAASSCSLIDSSVLKSLRSGSSIVVAKTSPTKKFELDQDPIKRILMMNPDDLSHALSVGLEVHWERKKVTQRGWL